MTTTRNDIVGQILGDPPWRHLAAIPDDADLLADARKTARIVAEEEADVIDRSIQRDQRKPIRHRAMAAPEPVTLPATRPWIMPGGRAPNGRPTIGIRSTGDVCLSQAVRRALTPKEGRLCVGVALLEDGTLLIERCHKTDPWSRLVNATTGMVSGGGSLDVELRAAGYKPGTKHTCEVDAERGTVIVRRPAQEQEAKSDVLRTGRRR